MSPVGRSFRACSIAVLLIALLPISSTIASPSPSAPAPQQVKVTEDLLRTVQYRQIGPMRQGGRFVDYAIPLQDTATIYAATASGGLWKSVNNGLTWELIFDIDDIFSVGAVAVAPSDPNLLWVGTGEGNNSRSAYWGNGVYKSTDAGATWTHMGLPESQHVGRIRIHPTNPDIVYVAALGHLYSDNPERGLYRTTDGGNTWDLVLTDVIEPGGNFEGETTRHIGVVDVVMDPRDPDVLYAATYDKVRKPWTFNEGGPGSRIYKTNDGGDNWEMLTNGLPAGMLGRIGLDVAMSAPDIVYAVIEDTNSEDVSDDVRYQELLDGRPPEVRPVNDRIWRSDDAGATWHAVSPEERSVGGTPPYYYGRIIVDPNDPDHVFVLSARSQKSTDGGATWERAWRFGGDDHALWINPANSKHMVMGYDHGMGVSFDGGLNWYHPDDMPLAQYYAVGVDMEYPYNIYGGLQDNGSWRGPSTKRDGGPIYFEDWESVGGGDGMYNVVDWSNNRYVYNESQFGPLSRLDLLTGERKSIRYSRAEDEEQLRWNWNAPILVSRHDSDVIYHAANVLLRSSFRGENWEEISPDLTTNDPDKIRGIGNIQYSTITAIDESPIVPGVLWVGTDDGNVWVTQNGGEDWTQLNDNITGNPEYWVSRVEASNHDPGTAYVSYTGYRRDDFRPFVYMTRDFGETWTPIASGLPDAPVNVIREDHKNPNLLLIGTEMGVYVSLDAGESWASMRQNMPTQPVHDLLVHPRENDIVVATHGQGIFVADISPLQEISPEILAHGAYLFDVAPMVRWVDNDRRAVSSHNFFTGESEPIAAFIYYYLENEAAEAPKISIYSGTRLINELEGTNEAGLNKVEWNGTVRRERTEEERRQYEETMERRRQSGGGFGRFGRPMDPDYVFSPAPVGDYTVVLTVGEKKLERRISIQKDHWMKVVEQN